MVVANSEAAEYSTHCAGDYVISQQVIEDIAKHVARQEAGVVLHSNARLQMKDWFQRDHTAMLLEDETGQFLLQLTVGLAYGANIPQKATQLQKKIHDAVYEMTEISLDMINIDVIELFMA